MDYTSDPDGPPSNEHPNQHDYDQLEAIYAHTDSFNSHDTSAPAAPAPNGNGKGSLDDRSQWGRLGSGAAKAGGVAVFERDLGGGQKLLTFLISAQ